MRTTIALIIAAIFAAACISAAEKKPSSTELAHEEIDFDGIRSSPVHAPQNSAKGVLQ